MRTTNLQGGRLEPHHAAGEISSVAGSGGSTGRLCILAGSCCRLPFDAQQHVNCVCLPRLIAARTSEEREQQNMFTHRTSSRHHQESSDGASMFEGLASASDLPVVVFNYAPFWCGSWHMSVCGGCIMGLASSHDCWLQSAAWSATVHAHQSVHARGPACPCPLPWVHAC